MDDTVRSTCEALNVKLNLTVLPRYDPEHHLICEPVGVEDSNTAYHAYHMATSTFRYIVYI